MLGVENSGCVGHRGEMQTGQMQETGRADEGGKCADEAMEEREDQALGSGDDEGSFSGEAGG